MPTALRAKAKTSQRTVAEVPRSSPRSCGNAPYARSAYATAYDALNRNRQFQEIKRNTKLRYVAIHVACLLVMFYLGRLAMPYSRRENVRHATFPFLRLDVVMQIIRKVRERDGGDENEVVDGCKCIAYGRFIVVCR